MGNEIENFYGVWKLSKWSSKHGPSQTERLVFGGNVDGHIIYSQDGWVSATLMEASRTAVSGDRLALGRLNKKIIDDPEASISEDDRDLIFPYFTAGFGYISYCGPFHLSGEKVHHQIVNSMIPQWVGTAQIRDYLFNEMGDQLTLSAQNGDTTDTLVWKRLACKG